MSTPQPVHLSEVDLGRLSVVLHRGKANVRTLKRAQVLFKLDAGWTGGAVAATCDVSPNTVTNVRKRFRTGGLDAVLSDRQQLRRRAALTGRQQAQLIAIASGTGGPRPLDAASAGWQGGRAGLRGAHQHRDHPDPFGQNQLKPWRHEQWCLPGVGADFVAATEDVLDLYEEEYDPRYPTVCLDEKPVVLHAETRPVQPVAPGHVERRDYEYVRQGTANLFVLVEPLAGWRHVAVTARRTKRDYAEQLRYLADTVYPDAEYIRLVQDNLNTHTLAALYEVCAPAEARRLACRFEVHSTPKHGSWLNMAEIEISVFQRGCLARPVADMTTLRQRVDALEGERNAAQSTIRWQFTSQQARTTLDDLYPVKQP